MVKINIPNNFIPERLYIVDILFNEFLELKYKVEIKKIKNYEIIFNNKKLTIKDYFFSIFKDDLEYLSKKNIPKKVKFIKNHFLIEKDIPIIYGNDELKMNENEIICGVDIFASSFFMLTRWEECVNKNRDIHNRFPVKESLAYNNDFLHRPVVNEYIEMLWNMLMFLGISQNRKEKYFKLILTHDVDYLYRWKSWKYIFRTMGGDILKRNNLKLAVGRINQYKNILRGKEKDPYDTFDWLMDKSESIGIKSRFYFMSRGITKHDNNYKIKEIIPTIKKIKKRGHIIGFHGSYASYNNYQQWRKEKELLESVYQGEITEGRQHFLRFEVPITWQIWEDNNMQIESTCVYADREGFRCGTSDEFSTFNVLTRKKLRLKEMPLVIMDSTLQNSNYRGLSPDEVLKVFNYYIKITKKYKSKVSILWHNSNFDFLGIEPIWRDVYEKVIGF
jgi:hypothetical protein